MREKSLFRTSDFIEKLTEIGAEVVLDKKPDESSLKRINSLLEKKKNLFKLQQMIIHS